MTPVEESRYALHDNRGGDGVDVPPGGGDASRVRTTTYDDVHDELLRRAAALVDRGRGRGLGVPEVVERGRVEVGTQITDVEVASDRNDLGERQLHNWLVGERLWVGPGAGRRGTGQRGQCAVADHQACRGVARAGGPSAFGRPPAVQTDRDLDLVRVRPSVQRSGDEQVGEPAVEGHRGDDGDAGVSSRSVELAVQLLHDRLLGGDVQVVGAGLDRGTCEWDGGVDERPGAVDDHPRADDRTPQHVRILEADHAVVELGVPRRNGGEAFGAAPGQHRPEAAPQQFVDDEA